MKMKSLIAGFALVLAAPAVSAQSALLDFSESMFSFSADFTQTVYDSDSVVLQESVGSVELLRPGRFRWTYTAPSSQVIVADGLTLWVYDEDIKQVTAQPQATTLGSAPIGLLSGEKTIEAEFAITELGEENGLDWFELEPLVQDTDFNAVYIALDENGLNAMELRDNFDQATQIKFTNFKKNATIEGARFTFTPPEGADVVGEVGTAQTPDSSGISASDTQPAIVTDSSIEADDDLLAEPVDDGLPPIAETEPLPEDNEPASTTIVDGNQVQIQEIRQ